MTFEITIQPSGHRFEMEAEENILEAALRHGYAFPYGCRDGACTSCAGKVLSGQVHYPEEWPLGLSEEDHDQGLALFCQAQPLSDLEIEVKEIGAAKDIVVKTLPSRIIHMEKLSPDVMMLQLKLPASERLQFLAGQYIDVLLKDGRSRSFSLANSPNHDEYLELHIRKVPGGDFTEQVFHNMKVKDLLRIKGPLGNFFLREDSDRPIIMMAGGTGFAPAKGMIEQALETEHHNPITLYWGVRAKADLYQGDLAMQWAREHEHISFIPVLSEPGADDHWSGRTGFVHEAVLEDHADLSAFDVYVCGPPPMVRAAEEAFLAHGLAPEHLFYDSFDYSPDTQKAINAVGK